MKTTTRAGLTGLAGSRIEPFSENLPESGQMLSTQIRVLFAGLEVSALALVGSITLARVTGEESRIDRNTTSRSRGFS